MSLFGKADDEGAAFGEIDVRDFGDEREIEVVREAGGVGSVVEEVDDVPAEAVFEATAFFEVEGTSGIDFDVAGLLEERGEDALKKKRSAAYLLHGEGDGVVRHANEYKGDAGGRSGRRCKVGCRRATQLFTMGGSVEAHTLPRRKGLSGER